MTRNPSRSSSLTIADKQPVIAERAIADLGEEFRGTPVRAQRGERGAAHAAGQHQFADPMRAQHVEPGRRAAETAPGVRHALDGRPVGFALQRENENLPPGGAAALDQPRRQAAIAGNDPERTGHCGYATGRYAAARSLPTRLHAVGVERGVLRALGALAGEADHVMRDQRRADQLRDAPGAQRLRGKSPEDPAIIAANADAEGNLGEQRRAAPQIAAVEPGAGQRQRQPVRIGVAQVPFVAREHRLGAVGMADRGAPGVEHLAVGPRKHDVRFARRVEVQPAGSRQPLPKRRLRQGLQQIDRQHRDMRAVDELDQARAGCRGVGVEAENDAGDDLDAVAIDRRHRVEQRHDPVVRLAHGVERAQLGRLDAAEHRVETRLAHHRENVRALRDIERRLAGELDRIAAPLLPGDQMRQQLARRFLVADEIVVDEIDRAGDPGVEHRVEFGEDLLRRFEPGLAPVQRRDVAEFAAIGQPLENCTLPRK